MDIVDEIPPLDTIPGDSFTFYLIAKERRETVHSITQFYLIDGTLSKDSFDKDSFKKQVAEQYKLLGLFIDVEEAEKFFHFALKIESLNYTVILHRQGNFNGVKNRPFVVYMDGTITKYPGFYRVRKVDYDKLCTIGTVHLASLEDIEEIPEVYSFFVPQNYEEVSSLGLSHIKAIDVACDISLEEIRELYHVIDEAYHTWKTLNRLCFLLVKETPHLSLDNVIKQAHRIFPDNPEYAVDELIKMYSDVKEGKDVYPLDLYINCETCDGREFKVNFS